MVVAIVLLIYFAALIAAFVVYLLYLRKLQRTLEKCAVQNRTMAPGMVWLQLVPVLGFGWQFVNVVNLGRSLEKEFRSRGVTVRRPCQDLGVIMGIVSVTGVVFTWLSDGLSTFTSMPGGLGSGPPNEASIAGLAIVGFLFFLAAFVLWILYWVRINKVGKRLDAIPRPLQQPWGRPQPAMGYPGGAYGSPLYQPPSYLAPSQPPIGPAAVAGAGVQPVEGGSLCRNCGTQFRGGRYCPSCGVDQSTAGG